MKELIILIFVSALFFGVVKSKSNYNNLSYRSKITNDNFMAKTDKK